MILRRQENELYFFESKKKEGHYDNNGKVQKKR